MKISQLKSLIKESVKEVLNENEDKKAAKLLRDGFGAGFSPREFGEYVEDYFKNPEEYNIDTESDYYEAIVIAWDQIADDFRRPVWQSTTVQSSPVYKYYIKLK